MEPLSHLLAGVCLAETGLKRATPLGAATLMVAATVADVDGACYLHSADLAFEVRRGLTHGVLAWVILPALVTAAMAGYDRAVRRRWDPGAPPARVGPLFWLALAGVLSHPVLDWLNSYGIRLLMPFSDRWFYGDTLFIADPWLWVILGTSVVMASTMSRRSLVVWTAIAIGTSALVVVNPLLPAWSRVAWLAFLSASIGARRLVPAAARPRAAWGSAALAMLYVAIMYGSSRAAERQVRELAAARGWRVGRVAAMPLPAQPGRRVVIAETPASYLLIPVDWARALSPDVEPAVVERGPSHPAVDAALALPRLRGTRGWLRFPSYEVVHRGDGGYRVIIRDARFSVGLPAGFGVIAIVDLDARLRPAVTPSS